MTMKILTITVPSYNSEKWLPICLDSMCGIDDRLEVIVVNDGSLDNTSSIAHAYEQNYPGTVKVIDKENGGHGSGINSGLQAATGKYFMVVDSDDWIVKDNLNSILDLLEQEDVDVFILGHQTYNVTNNRTEDYIPHSNSAKRKIDIIKLNDKYDDVSTCLTLHSLCYKTEFLFSSGLQMSEHTYYEDQEYAILPFIYANSFYLYPQILYVYRIGDKNQSVSLKNQAKLVNNHNRVVVKIIEYYTSRKPLGKARDDFLQKRISIAVTSNYAAFLVKYNDKKAGREKAVQFREWLKNLDPALAKTTEKKYRLLRHASYFSNLSALYEKVFNSSVYVKLVKLWIK